MVATPGNSLNITAAGLVKFDGTSVFSGVTVTQHDLLIGAASNGITSVAPSATSGVPVISQGASSDPIFGTAVVAGGGTGSVTLTNHGVLLGQGTSAIVATAAGSSGQVLQSGGSSADAAYSTATYPATATGTGKILRADGTNWAATTATYPNTAGTSGNVLTSDGTNWNSSAASGGSNLVLIQSQTASASASLSFTTGITATYNNYLVLISNYFPATNGASLELVISSNGGSSYASTAYQGGIFFVSFNSAIGTIANANTSSYFPILNASGSSGNSFQCGGTVNLFNVTNGNTPSIVGYCSGSNTTNVAALNLPVGNQQSITTVNAIRFICTSGNISTGVFTLFGILE